MGNPPEAEHTRSVDVCDSLQGKTGCGVIIGEVGGAEIAYCHYYDTS